MNAAKNPVVETFSLVEDPGRAGTANIADLITADKLGGFLGLDYACKSVGLSILLRHIRSVVGTFRTFGLDRWGGPVGTGWDVAALRLAV